MCACETSIGRVVFGGPDLPARRLRDLLYDEVEAVPSGGRIDWATYYFRDQTLADALLRAQQRGVTLRLVMEARPRRDGANEPVIERLQRGGLCNFHPRRWWPGRVHSKIYSFSHPDRCWIGSFNPSGNEPEEDAVIAEIGDQDRGDNLLVELIAPELVAAARGSVSALTRGSSLGARFDPHYPRQVTTGDTQLFFYPRLRVALLERRLRRLGPGDKVRAAISHLKPGPLLSALEAGADRGAHIQLMVHDSERRVPSDVLKRQVGRPVDIQRVGDTVTQPMHAKMLHATIGGRQEVWTGSFNFNFRSRYANAETLIASRDRDLCTAVAQRLDEIGARRNSA